MAMRDADRVRSLEIEAGAVKDLALIDSSDGIWIVAPLMWWDLATWFWWFLTPSDRRATVTLTTGDGVKFRCKAVRVASKHARVRWK